MNLEKTNNYLYLNWQEFLLDKYKQNIPVIYNGEKDLGYIFTDNDLQSLERSLGTSLPEDLKIFYKKYGSINLIKAENNNLLYWADFSDFEKDLKLLIPLHNIPNLNHILEETKELRENRLIPEGYIVLGKTVMNEKDLDMTYYHLMSMHSNSYGHIFCWPKRVNIYYDEDDDLVFKDIPWGKEGNTKIAFVNTSFTAFLSMLKNYDDPEVDEMFENQIEKEFEILWDW